MSLWETSCCIQSLSIELHEHIGNSSPQFLPELLSILKSISGRGDEAIRMQNLALGHYRATMCVKLASAFVSALRVAHKCARFDVDMQRHWNRSPMTRTTAWGRQFALYLSTLTVEGILRAYTAIPPGHIHTACEHEISWYFKLVEDRITYGELDNAVSKKDVCIPVLQSNLERAVTVGVHFSLAASCVGASRIILRTWGACETHCDLWLVSESASIVIDAISCIASYRTLPLILKDGLLTNVCEKECRYKYLSQSTSRELGFYASLLSIAMECGGRGGYGWILRPAMSELTLPELKGRLPELIYACSTSASSVIECLEQELTGRLEEAAQFAIRITCCGHLSSTQPGIPKGCLWRVPELLQVLGNCIF
jgi:hypothetical protein